MYPEQTLFVGGSRNGIRESECNRPTVTFVDGYLAVPGPDGSLDKPINATVEMYVLEEVEVDRGTLSAYFLAGMDTEQRQRRLNALIAA